MLFDASNLRTDRLHLAPLLPEAAEELHAITDNPLITDAISFLSTPFSLDDAQALIRDHFNDRERFYGIRSLQNMQLVGVIGAHLHDPIDLEIGYWVGIDFQRRNYAFEAANAFVTYLTQVCPHCRIIAECRPDNKFSWRVLERIGFRSSGEVLENGRGASACSSGRHHGLSYRGLQNS